MSKVRKRNRNENFRNPLTDEEIMLLMAYPETKEHMDIMQGYIEEDGFCEWECDWNM